MRTTKEGYHVAILFNQQFAEEMKMQKVKLTITGSKCRSGYFKKRTGIYS
jgi:hypothetical protein